jgi:hypothetical protein
MGKAYARAGEHEDGANPKWWCRFADWGLVELGISDENF